MDAETIEKFVDLLQGKNSAFVLLVIIVFILGYIVVTLWDKNNKTLAKQEKLVEDYIEIIKSNTDSINKVYGLFDKLSAEVRGYVAASNRHRK